jgi:hypothetical protein
MELEEVRHHEAARKQGLSLHRHGDDEWSLGAPPSTEPLRPGVAIEPSETLLSGDRVRLASGRVIKRRLSTRELRIELSLEDPGEETA